MNTSTSEYSSGCESGWTKYLDPYTRSLYEEKGGYVSDVEEEEDLSMVSDASSDPPYYGYAAPAYEDKKESKNKSKRKSKPSKDTKQHKSLCLDDTASSSIFHFSHEDNVSRTDDRNSAGHVYFEDESRTKKRLSFFKSSKSGSLLGRKRQ